jgi:hypothetical protein
MSAPPGQRAAPGQRWSWRWWFDLSGPPVAGRPGPLGRARLVARVASLVALAAAALPVLVVGALLAARRAGGEPLAGLDIALAALLLGLPLLPQLASLAVLASLRRLAPPWPAPRPASWYRFVTVAAALVLACALAGFALAFALPAGVRGPRYPETAALELWFRLIQAAILPLVAGLGGATAGLAVAAGRRRQAAPASQRSCSSA